MKESLSAKTEHTDPTNCDRQISTRRDWLRTSCLGLGSTWLASRSAVSWAIEPFTRPDSKFKSSLAAYSYRNLLQGDGESLTLFDFIDDCARFGLDGTELTSYYFPDEFDEAYLHRLAQRAFQLGLDISGTAVGNDFGHPPGDKRDEQIALVERWITHAATLGAPVIRIFAGKQHAGVNPSETHRLIVQGIDHCCRKAGEHGVHLALENHGGPTATVDGLLAIVRDVESRWFGVNLDTGNFHSKDVYRDLRQAAPYALNVQVKIAVSGPDGKKQPTDYKRLAEILRDAHYRGYVVLEFEERGDPRVECERHLEQMSEAFAF